MEPKHRSTAARRHEREEPEHEESSALERIEAGEVLEKVESFAREQPHIALAGALALGFVIGGGISPRMLGALAALGARTYLQGKVSAQLADLKDSF
jgi:hypothetical protein